jgi:clan AA aspartic protease
VTKLKLTNSHDVEAAREGRIRPEDVRSVEVEALVDTGAVDLIIPDDVASALGLRAIDRRWVRYADGRIDEVPLVGGLLIEILGRPYQTSAYVLPAGTTALIGQIPLEALDLVVNPRTCEVTSNPAHPDAPIVDLLHVA